jgi:hypothetical protein
MYDWDFFREEFVARLRGTLVQIKLLSTQSHGLVSGSLMRVIAAHEKRLSDYAT